MIELFHKYRIHGRTRGRKNIQLINYKYFTDYLVNLRTDIIKCKNNILDVGSGSGENTIFLAEQNPDTLIIACEIFHDGNINLYNQLIKLKFNNIKLFRGNVIQLFDQLKIDSYFNEIWILFPDPWPKNRHHKRRLINNNFFKKVYPFLKKEGKIFIATDSIPYLNSMLNNIYDIKSLFRWKNDKPNSWIYKTKDLPQTKFYKKAENVNRTSFFIELEKI